MGSRGTEVLQLGREIRNLPAVVGEGEGHEDASPKWLGGTEARQLQTFLLKGPCPRLDFVVTDLLTLSTSASLAAWEASEKYKATELLGARAGGEDLSGTEVPALSIVPLLSPPPPSVGHSISITETTPNWITGVTLPKEFPETLTLPNCGPTQATSNYVLSESCFPC